MKPVLSKLPNPGFESQSNLRDLLYGIDNKQVERIETSQSINQDELLEII